ncbi:YjcZ family sporulation protein [Halolactibacillus alkaliphilus]|uniref:YjcZ family sporulation protein n=1 Tax=Halolactibacillus alkaliphilus TaxID=442899 RepID=UPI001E5A221B|nr:YjcZ family sporulation protein [Halolactibacillus alkaliphilus]
MGCHEKCYDKGCDKCQPPKCYPPKCQSSQFSLLVVLFILLIIIGASMAKPYC